MIGRSLALRSCLSLAIPLALSACTYQRAGPPKLHFEEFKTIAPKGNTVTVCHAYGCQEKTDFTFTGDDLTHIATLMDGARAQDSPHEERRAIAYAVGWIEARVGKAVGTTSDRASIDVFGSNDPTQQDCVDEATNTTSYLMVLARHGLLRHHTVYRPFAKGNLLLGIWPHWTAVIKDRTTGQTYAVDSSNGANGGNPEILTTEAWYIDTSGPKKAPAAPGGDDLGRMVDGILADGRPGPLTTGSLR